MSTPRTDSVAKRYETNEIGAAEVLIHAAELERENIALRRALTDADIVAEYEGEDGRRDWWGSGYWLHTGEVLVCMDRAAIDAARKEAQP